MSETSTHGPSRPLSWAVLLAAVVQVMVPAVNAVSEGSSPGEGSGPELLITPVGWAFSIWGVIYALAIAQAIAAVLRPSSGVTTRFQVDQLVLYVFAAVWIVMAGLDSSTATFLALAVMFAAAVDGVLTLSRSAIAPRWFALLTRGAFGLFAGWVSAAFFLNLSTAVVDWGLVEADALVWQLVVLVVAASVIVALVLRTRLLAYAAAGVWAFFAIAVTGVDDDTTEVVVVAVIEAVIVLGAALSLLATRSHARTPTSRGATPSASPAPRRG